MLGEKKEVLSRDSTYSLGGSLHQLDFMRWDTIHSSNSYYWYLRIFIIFFFQRTVYIACNKLVQLTSPTTSIVFHGERTKRLRGLGPLEPLFPINHFRKGSRTPAMSKIEVKVFSKIKPATWSTSHQSKYADSSISKSLRVRTYDVKRTYKQY